MKNIYKHRGRQFIRSPKGKRFSCLDFINEIVNEEEAIYDEHESPEPIFLGEFTSTGYCPCEKCCGKWSNPSNPLTAIGNLAVEGVTIGADWDTLSPGTMLYIEGIGERVVQDKLAKWIVERYDGKILDLYYESHEDAWNHGRQIVSVWLLPDEI
ncbi:MAG: 3D domain-containing protein [Oscillospiraceae bacterium]|nr:3D domain-containing protein [Oscillospiraceae bacterium]